MVGASKILTVSYGTFSCTLEGFDEPFNTMKAIAEYFRDLAAEDRYFGAEPPTPDTEMLHRIAEREVQRRVDAKIEANGIVLRPRQVQEDAPASVAADSAAGAAPKAEAPVKPQPTTTDKAAAPVAPAAEVDPISESVAAKLQRIRAAVAQARAAAAAAPAFEEDEQPDAFESEEAAEAPEEFGYELDLAGPLQTDDDESAAEDDVAKIRTESEVEEAVVETPAPECDAAPESGDTSDEDLIDTLEWDDDTGDAAPVRRAESVVEQRRERRRATRAAALAAAAADLIEAETATASETDSAPVEIAEADEASEPQDETGFAPEPDRVAEAGPEFESDADAEVAAKPHAEAETEAEPLIAQGDQDEETEEGGDLAELLAASLSDEDQAVTAEDETLEDIVEAPAKPEPLILAHVIKVPRNDEPTAEELGAAQGEENGQDDGDPLLLISPQDPEDGAESLIDSVLSTDEDADLMRELASLERAAEKTEPAPEAEASDAEVESWASNLEEDDELGRLLSDMADGDAVEPVAVVEEGALEAVAMEEAAPDAELEPEQSESPVSLDTVAAQEEPTTTDTDEPAAIAAVAPPADPVGEDAREADVSRLIEETNTKLEGAESRRRFSAIAHLKAAVAATMADRLVRGGERGAKAKKEKQVTEAYREDLTRAVHPRRPVATGEANTLRPSLPQARPAPLMLVSEQRIDNTDGAVATVRPRRIAATRHSARPGEEEAAPSGPISAEDARSFAEFAESLGSSGLSELLEAAAAYTSTIEGRPHFSPPQILRKVASVADEGNFSREESLRSFGQLLRQGKIAKIRRGQYAITEQSRFFEEGDRAAN